MKYLRFFLYALFLAALILLAAKLFFEPKSQPPQNVEKLGDLTITTPFEPITLVPDFTVPTLHEKFNNVFEPLVKTDRDLSPQPGLAVSWGLVDNNTWIFNLRSGVKFHDGSAFTADDLVSTYDNAMNKAGVSEFLNTIGEIKTLDNLTVQISTIEPDPLLPQKLSLLPILSSDDHTQGTGPYIIVGLEKGENMVFKPFYGYWGKPPKFNSVKFIFDGNADNRIEKLISGEVDMVEFVPSELLPMVEKGGMKYARSSLLETDLLLFNLNAAPFLTLEGRQAVSLAINKDELIEKLGRESIGPADQFVNNGVFGYNPAIAKHEYDLEKARELAQKSGLTQSGLGFFLYEGSEGLGEYIREQMEKIGVEAYIEYISFEDDPVFLADLYFLVFKSTLGDSTDFLKDVALLDGVLNSLSGYYNPEVEKLLHTAQSSMNERSRLRALREAMRIVLEEDVIGIPLFQMEAVYAFSPRLKFTPRIDGLVYFDELEIE